MAFRPSASSSRTASIADLCDSYRGRTGTVNVTESPERSKTRVHTTLVAKVILRSGLLGLRLLEQDRGVGVRDIL